ncbi:hypothetical protein H4R35_005625 [Dimargaris xerosporica]|nr:hypothetical protein H4R35_005625 [Dimargaris xerosporica]
MTLAVRYGAHILRRGHGKVPLCLTLTQIPVRTWSPPGPALGQFQSRSAHFSALPGLWGALSRNDSTTSSLSPLRQSSTISPDPSAQAKAQQLIQEGTELLQRGQVIEASHLFRQSAEFHATATAYFNLGVCHYQSQQFAEAVAAWQQSLDLAPDHADVHVNLASAYFLHLKDAHKALTHLEKATELAPDDGEVHYNYGCILEATGQLEQAIEKYRRALGMGVKRADMNLRNAMARYLKAQSTKPPSSSSS